MKIKALLNEAATAIEHVQFAYEEELQSMALTLKKFEAESSTLKLENLKLKAQLKQKESCYVS